MTDHISAASGTFLIEANEEGSYIARIIPVIGWIINGPNNIMPMTPFGWTSYNPRLAVQHPDGTVCSPHLMEVYANTADWLSVLSGTDIDDLEAPTAGLDHVKPQETEVPENTIQLGTKVYRTRSYWSHPESSCIFTVEPGEPYPNDPLCEKITRDQFMAMKKDEGIQVHEGIPAASSEAPEAGEEEFDADIDDMV